VHPPNADGAFAKQLVVAPRSLRNGQTGTPTGLQLRGDAKQVIQFSALQIFDMGFAHHKYAASLIAQGLLADT
jgi:hypothetical protein